MAKEPIRFKRGCLADLVERLRRLSILGDAQIRPYADASISLERLRIDELVPLSKYVLEDQLRFVDRTRQSLLADSVDILDLDCGFVWPAGDSNRPLAAPIVEEWDGALLLVDGLHRIWTARSLGLAAVTCAVVRCLEVPLMTLPASWNDIRVFPQGQVPSPNEKRNYRFTDMDSLKEAAPKHANRVTAENYRYFFYRNLEELGSGGVRTDASSETRGDD